MEAIKKWLKQSSIGINDYKTENSLFHRHDVAAVPVKIGNNNITSKKVINELGVLFDTNSAGLSTLGLQI
jgi:hypothetical protein